MPVPPRDLVDFHLRWAEFRPIVAALVGKDCLTKSETGTLEWLVALADRIGLQDIT